MADMDAVTEAKSDQINADDLISSDKTVTVSEVIIRAGTEQPITVKLAGENKVFRPCKSVARVMKAAWGPDSAVYKGRSLTLYRDPDVLWAGVKVGGIRVREISHITAPLVLCLQEKKGSKKTSTVMPLKVREPATDDARAGAEEYVTTHLARVRGAADQDAIDAIRKRGATAVGKIQAAYPDLYQSVLRGYEERSAQVSGYGDGTLAADNPAATEGRDTSDMGDQHDGSADQ